MSAAIETEQLTKNYGKNPGIRHVDLKVEEGEVFQHAPFGRFSACFGPSVLRLSAFQLLRARRS